jgi:hypothetical protein
LKEANECAHPSNKASASWLDRLEHNVNSSLEQFTSTSSSSPVAGTLLDLDEQLDLSSYDDEQDGLVSPTNAYSTIDADTPAESTPFHHGYSHACISYTLYSVVALDASDVEAIDESIDSSSSFPSPAAAEFVDSADDLSDFLSFLFNSSVAQIDAAAFSSPAVDSHMSTAASHRSAQPQQVYFSPDVPQNIIDMLGGHLPYQSAPHRAACMLHPVNLTPYFMPQTMPSAEVALHQSNR